MRSLDRIFSFSPDAPDWHIIDVTRDINWQAFRFTVRSQMDDKTFLRFMSASLLLEQWVSANREARQESAGIRDPEDFISRTRERTMELVSQGR